MKQEKRYLSVEEYTKWKLFSIIWLSLFLETMFILYNIFVYDIKPSKDFVWITIDIVIVIMLFIVFSLFSVILTYIFEKKFRKFWIDYHHDRCYKYYESKIKKSLVQRLIFLVFSIIINVLLVCFVVFFSWTLREIKNISKACWISYHQSYWITKLPEEDKNLVLESCTENQKHQHLGNVISRFNINNPDICSFNSKNIDEAMSLYFDFEKGIRKSEKTINEIKDIISKKIQLMDKDFDWNLWYEYHELVKFQKRIDENLAEKLKISKKL